MKERMFDQDAPERSQGWGLRLRRAPARRALGLLALSMALHVGATPVGAWFGLIGALQLPVAQPAVEEPLDAFVVDLLEAPEAALPAPTEEPLAAPEVAIPGNPEVLEAGAERRDPQLPAPAADKPSLKAAASAGSGADPARGSEGAPPSPIELSGVRRAPLDSNAKVHLFLAANKIRQHALAPRLGRLVQNLPQWSSFFAAAGVDPVADLDLLLLTSSSFRRTADAVVVLRHRLGGERMRQAVESLAARPPTGRWLEGAPPAALAHADRAERLFVLSSPDVLVVAPPHLERAVRGAGAISLGRRTGGEAAVVLVKDPATTLGALPLALPESLKMVRLAVEARSDGGALVTVLAEDRSAALAESHAQDLTVAVNALTNPSLGKLGALLGVRTLSFLDPIRLRAEGPTIKGTAPVTAAQLERLLAIVESMVGISPPARSLPAAP